MTRLHQKLPELLAPAGNLEKLKIAVRYGADAVYLAGQKFGLRSAAPNFTEDELTAGVAFAHANGVKVYVTLNGFLHDTDLEPLPEFVRFLDTIGVDAVIVADLGVMTIVQNTSTLPIHISTQASCLNAASARFWKTVGATRIILGREVSIAEAHRIKVDAKIPVEMFIHGSLCMAYSGNCTISNYTKGRDSNRGGCCHSCRFGYTVEGISADLPNTSLDARSGHPPDTKMAFYNRSFMSSKDLWGINRLPNFIEAGIDSIKIEGRMKSNLYVATVTKAYAEALRRYPERPEATMIEELTKVPNRGYTEASLVQKAGKDSISTDQDADQSPYRIAGTVLESVPGAHLLVAVKNGFSKRDHVEYLPFQGRATILPIDEMSTVTGHPIDVATPSTVVKMPYREGVAPWTVLRVLNRNVRVDGWGSG